ncbi:hypothetical protein ONE63_011362 [Megalurothrips usitatus]|uniref:MULE transposase domain-containing protein n=1 Tax=Megalurothrips usitatus TaxID=439358 RepID=A0AAV7X3G7_9NEOP|nr:hypothetical protein ONE63_011362 [Megalurothrips usitatus]
MRRARLERYPKIPATLSELGALLRDKGGRGLTRTKDGADNIFRGAVGSSARKTRSIIFMSKRMRRYLRRAKEIFVDGTWKSRPAKPDSSQLLSISCLVEGRIVPLVLVLMQRRTKSAYVKLLETLRDMGLNPDSVHTDFEGPLYESFRTVFPDIETLGCLIHFVRCLKNKAKKLKLTRFLRRTPLASRIVRCCNALPLLPADNIRTGLLTVVRAAKQYGVFRRLKGFLKYVKDVWASKPDVLSVFEEANRTNNVAESWNRTLRLAVKVKRPNIWIFLDALVRLEDRTQVDLYMLRRGMTPRRLRAAKAVSNDSRIKLLTRQLMTDQISMMEFLRFASYRTAGVWNPLM